MQLTLARAVARTAWKGQPLGAEVLDRRDGRAGSGEGGEQRLERVLHLSVGVEDDSVERVVDQPHRQGFLEHTALGPVQQPTTQTGLEQVQLRLRHGTFESKQKPVIELRGVVDAVLVEDQRMGQTADLEQRMPIDVVSRQARGLEAEHDTGSAHADLGDQVLESLPIAVGTGLAKVGVDHGDVLDRPSQREGALTQRILTLRALGVLEHLSQRRLTHVQVSGAGPMAIGHLVRGQGHGDVLVARCARVMASRMSMAWTISPDSGCSGERRRRGGATSPGDSTQVHSQAARPRRARTARPWIRSPDPGLTA